MPENLYTQIGVRPLINAKGTFTIVSGSRSLPEVKQAMYEASQYFVQLDELMEAVGAELGQLTGAEWGIATTGCEAAIALAVVACIAGTDPEKSQALPYVMGRDEVIIPTHSRNQYDFGVRMTGVKIVEVDSAEQLQDALTDRTAMVYIYSSPAAEDGPLRVENVCAMARAKSVPVFVDAAAEEPLNPNIHLQHGASLVGYSGGKCLRGPQSSGLLIGQKDLCRAAYFQASPHHNYGRAFKCSKEETMGLLAAVRQWYRRDHAAEQQAWLSWLQHIEARLESLASLTTEYLHPVDLSNRSPRLHIRWEPRVLAITGTEVAARLDAGDPRIVLHEANEDSVIVMPYMMEAGEERVVADALYEVLSHPGPQDRPSSSSGAPSYVEGQWQVIIHYLRGIGGQQFTLVQRGSSVEGQQQGELYSATMSGEIEGDHVRLRSSMLVPGSVIDWSFSGTVHKDTMTGMVNMGEYGSARWEARKGK